MFNWLRSLMGANRFLFLLIVVSTTVMACGVRQKGSQAVIGEAIMLPSLSTKLALTDAAVATSANLLLILIDKEPINLHESWHLSLFENGPGAVAAAVYTISQLMQLQQSSDCPKDAVSAVERQSRPGFLFCGKMAKKLLKMNYFEIASPSSKLKTASMLEFDRYDPMANINLYLLSF